MPPQDVPLDDGDTTRTNFLAPDIKKDRSGINKQYLASGIVTLGALAVGCSMSWSSSAIPLLTTKYKELDQPGQRTHETWIAAILNFGAVLGAIPAGLISENFGRKFTLLSLAVPMIVSWILIASSPSTWGLYVGRFVTGVTIGAISVSIPPYMADIAEVRIRNRISNFYHIQLSAGILYGYLIGMVESVSIMSLLSAVVPGSYFIAFLFMPESPVYLTTQGKHTEALISLQYFRGIDNDVNAELEAFREDIRDSFRNRGTFKSIVSNKSTLKALIITFGLMTFQQMSGFYAIIFYATRIFEKCDTMIPPQILAILLGLVLFSSTLVSHLLLKKAGNRVLLLISNIVMALSIGSVGVYFLLLNSMDEDNRKALTWIPVLGLLVYVSSYAIGVGPIPWLLLRQIFPRNITRRCTALAAAVNWFMAFLVTVMFQNMVQAIGYGWVMWNFGVVCLVGALFVYFFVPETKGKDLQDIQNDLNGVRRRRRHRHIIEIESFSVADE